MSDTDERSGPCLSCGRTEEESPLIPLHFRSREVRICPQCLPILIHHPDRLDRTLRESGASS